MNEKIKEDIMKCAEDISRARWKEGFGDAYTEVYQSLLKRSGEFYMGGHDELAEHFRLLARDMEKRAEKEYDEWRDEHEDKQHKAYDFLSNLQVTEGTAKA